MKKNKKGEKGWTTAKFDIIWCTIESSRVFLELVMCEMGFPPPKFPWWWTVSQEFPSLSWSVGK